MPDKKRKKNKHLTLEDRMEIQGSLDHGMTFKAIGRRIGKDQTTISKEVKRHLEIQATTVRGVDGSGNLLRPTICPSLLKAPFVCNPCTKRHARCCIEKRFYRAKSAQKEYERMLSESREGVPLNKEVFYEMDQIISEGVKRGQHLYHIMQSNDLGASKSTVYRHLHRGYLSVSAIDFPRVVKFKPRRKKPEGYVPARAKIGRTHSDFLAYTEENEVTAWVEMDTVIGRVGGKTILTLDFTLCNFMIGILLENNSSAQVTEKIRLLKSILAANCVRFGDVFPLILTDNGGEFSNASAVENDLDGIKETSLFFCDPYQSSQKPRVEKNHSLFRDIVSKGESFDCFSQDTVNLLFSHVNSVKRKSLNGKTSYEMFSFAFSEELAHLLGIFPITARDVVQSKCLLKHTLLNHSFQ
jgi:IS30 family transposase